MVVGSADPLDILGRARSLPISGRSVLPIGWAAVARGGQLPLGLIAHAAALGASMGCSA
jgi:hypothetical protein